MNEAPSLATKFKPAGGSGDKNLSSQYKQYHDAVFKKINIDAKKKDTMMNKISRF